MKTQLVFLLAVALVLPLATAFNCTPLSGEEYKVCNYIEDQSWPQPEKDSLIQDAIYSNDASLSGNFIPLLGEGVPCTIQLNKPEAITQIISDDNKVFLIDISSMSLLGYIIYAFLKKYYLLLNFL